MINAIVGRTRSGKSYEAVRYNAIEQLKKNRMVVTNLSLNIDRICAVYGEHLRDLIVVVESDFSDFTGKPTDHYFSTPDHFIRHTWKNDNNQGPYFIIDEAHFVFGEGCTSEVKKFLAMHGHYGFDILLLTQDVSQLDKVVRKMPDIAIRTIKLGIVGNDKQYKRKVYSSCQFRNAEFISEETRDYDPAYFDFYSSHTLSSSSVTETKLEDLKGGGFFPNKKPIIFVLGFAVLLLIFIFNRMFSTSPVEVPEAKVVPVENPSIQSTHIPSNNNPANLKPNSNPVPSPAPVAAPQPSDFDLERHPFDKVSLHIVGRSKIVGNGRYIDSLEISASKRNRVIFDIDSNDLFKAGYDVEVYSDCSARITYNEYEDFLVCDSPDRSEGGSNSVTRKLSLAD